MLQFNVPLGLNISLLNASKCQLDSTWHYCDVTSPFSRIYLITEGEGHIYPNNQKTLLEPGYLYLVPSYLTCSYTCSNTLTQYYLHFTQELNEGLNIFDLCPIVYKIKATDTDAILFERLLELNPEIGLRISDPVLYQQKSWLNKSVSYSSIAQYFETLGIIYQLFSRFLTSNPISQQSTDITHRYSQMLAYIQQHLDKEISIKELADKVCLSSDHFTRSFKKSVGIAPLDYINQKRVEKAQLLLATTNLPLKEVLVKTGFNSASYFNRMFRKFTGSTPLGYRKNQHVF